MSQLSTGVSTGRALGVVGDLEQLERPLAGDRLAVEGHRAEARLDRVARAVVAAIDPGIDGEGLAGDEHASPCPTIVRRDWSVTSAVIS